MSLINQMLKDLEKRRSRDLETSPALNRNINWETRPDSKAFNWQLLLIALVVVLLLAVIGYLVWERTTLKGGMTSSKQVTSPKKVLKTSPVKSTSPRPVKKTERSAKPVKPVTRATALEEVVSSKAYAEAIETEGAIDADAMESDIAPVTINKKVRQPSKEQQAELVYQQAYNYLQQNNPARGKQELVKALELYPQHIKAREILAGIYIKSGHFVDAAGLLKEGVRLVPEYSLFAKLYARVLLEQGNPREAIRVLEKGATVLEVEPDYHALLAATYQRVNEHEKATRLYLQLVKLDPAAGVWWLGLGISLEKSGKENEALDAFQRSRNTGNLNAGLTRFVDKRITLLREKQKQQN